MKRIAAAILLILFLLPLCAFAADGDPLLSVDDLITMEDAYRAFLDELADMVIERGLLDEAERENWMAAQLGDYYQNGGYGSILASYMPGILNLVREEETRVVLHAQMENGDVLELCTLRRYSPQDSGLTGLALTFSLEDAAGAPLDAIFGFGSTSGLFYKWDAMTGAYVSVGMTAQCDGETIVWSDQAPAQGARNPVITIDVMDALTGLPVAAAELTLTVDGDGYRIDDYALVGVVSLAEESEEAEPTTTQGE